MTEWLDFYFSLSCIGEGNGNPLQCSCLENPRDGGAWLAAVYGVAQSWTRLKRLSSSSSSMYLTIRHQNMRGEKLTELQGKTHGSTLIVGNFNILLRKRQRQKICKDTVNAAPPSVNWVWLTSIDYFFQQQQNTHSFQTRREHSPRQPTLWAKWGLSLRV